VFTYPASCDVPEETLVEVTAWLLAHRRDIGTRFGRRAGTVRAQAKLVLRWFRDGALLRQLAAEAGIGISTAYRYLHEGIDVIAEQAPDLHDVLERGGREGWSHVSLDGTLIEIDRVAARNENGHHLWYSGKHKAHGGNVQIVADPSGFPVWSSPVCPGSVHDIAAAREHCLGALYAAASRGVADPGRQGLPGSRHRGPYPGQGQQPARVQRQLQPASDRRAGPRGTRQRRTQTTLELPTPNPPVPQPHRRHRRRRNRAINPTTRKLLRKPRSSPYKSSLR